MKSIQTLLVRSILVAALATISAGAASAYDHDKTGWFDNDHHHHAFVRHHGHRGYWDHDRNGARVFITI
jgi:hypothetical protein